MQTDSDGIRKKISAMRYVIAIQAPMERRRRCLVPIALAAIGFVSFSTVPAERQQQAVGTVHANGQRYFVWPIWSQPLSRSAIEAFLNHPALIDGELEKLGQLKIIEIFRARRVANGKLINVSRASPVGS